MWFIYCVAVAATILAIRSDYKAQAKFERDIERDLAESQASSERLLERIAASTRNLQQLTHDTQPKEREHAHDE